MKLNTIYNQDCFDGLKEIKDKSINLILTDPPYGVTAEKWDVIVDFNTLWDEYKRVITDDGVIVIFGQEPFSPLVRSSNLEMYKYDIYWKKQKPSNFQLMGYQMGRVPLYLYNNAIKKMETNPSPFLRILNGGYLETTIFRRTFVVFAYYKDFISNNAIL